MRTKSADSTLSLSNVHVTIKDKEILKDVRAEAKSGDLLAILGPTGSGKTTLLNVLSGRLKSQTGEITLDGQPFNKRLRRRLAYVQQQDVFFSQLTLWETLYFTAQIRLPESFTQAQKKERVEEIIETLDMKKCANTIIGDIFVRGLSGGEKKRASIACELLTDPDILLMDEPTSGLDSSTAQSIMMLMKSYANNFNKTIITTIHQPSSQIYRLFNNILLLVNGQEAYFGPAKSALDHFSSIGLTCEINFNPADFLLQVVKSDEETVLKIINEAQRKRHAQMASNTSLEKIGNGVNHDTVDGNHVTRHADVKVLINDDKDESDVQLSLIQKKKEPTPDDVESTVRDRWVTSWFTQYKMLSWRSIKQTFGQLKQGYLIIQTSILSLIIGLIYWQIDLKLDTVRDVQGLLFFAISYWSFNPAFEQVVSFLAEKAVIAKERAAGSYRLSAYFMAKCTSDLGLQLILPSCQFLFLYLCSGIGGAVNFFSTWPILLLQIPLAQSVGLLIVTIFPDFKPALTAMVSYMLSSFMLGGFFSQEIPVWLEWGKYFSIMLYSFGAVNIIIFRDMQPTLCNATSVVEYPQCTTNTTAYIYPDDILHNAGIDLPIPCYVSMMFVMICIIRIMGYLVIRFKRQILL